MSKYEIKELLGAIAFAIVNVVIAYLITTEFGIQNIVLYESFATAMQYTITYEVIIFMALSLVECLVYHFKYEKCEM